MLSFPNPIFFYDSQNSRSLIYGSKLFNECSVHVLTLMDSSEMDAIVHWLL